MSGSQSKPTTTGRRPGGLRVRPLATDITVVVLLLLAGLAQTLRQERLGHAPNGALLLTFILVLPLVWRRRAPLTVFAFIAAVAFGQWLTGLPAFADFALLWAFYAVAAYAPTRRTVIAGLALELGVVLAVVRDGGHGQDVLGGFLFLSALVTAAGVLGVNVRIRRAYLAAVEQRAAQLEFERDQQSQLAVAAERARIAREMHDVIAHNLTVVVALTDGAALTVATNPARAAAAITEASAAGRTALCEMRQVLGVLRDTDQSASMTPAPAVGDLDALLETVRRTGIDVRFETEGRLDDLGSGLELTIFRLVQEAVTNTVKHAVSPSHIVVRLARSDHEVSVRITDDGSPQPSTAANVAAGTGQGLVGMRERVAVHAGQVETGATPHGWQVAARLPVGGTRPPGAAPPPAVAPSPAATPEHAAVSP
jgi:signal transduction histidine kinase